MISLPIALSELQALMDEVGEYPTKKVPTWSERMEKQEESWEGFRPKILDEILKHLYLPDDVVSSA